MENYEETGWSAMSGLEADLQQLEANIDKHFGDDGEEKEQVQEGLFVCNTIFDVISAQGAYKIEVRGCLLG